MNRLENQQAAEQIDRIYMDLEELLMQNIMRHCRDYGQPIATDEWLLKKLAEIGKLNKENIKIIAQFAGLSRTAVERMLNEAAEEALNQVEPALAYLTRRGLVGEPVELPKSKSVQRTVKTLQDQAKDTTNLCNTTMLYKARDAYKKLITNISFEASEISQKQDFLDSLNKHATATVIGAESRQQAVRKCIKEFNDKGIPAFVDKKGREWTPEAYVNMAMRNTAKNVADEVQSARCQDYGVNLIEISSHSGARPKCAKDQGKIYDLNNGSGYVEDATGKKVRYYPWNSTSYGEPDGILGINCTHHKFPFWPGVSLQTYFPVEDQEASDRLYKQTQVQRAMERDIRKQKRLCMLYDEAGEKDAFEEASVVLKQKEAQLKNYIDKHPQLHRQKDREQVVGFDRSISAKAVAANKRTQALSKMAVAQNGMDWTKTESCIVSKEEKAELMAYARERNINIIDLSKFDGDKFLLKKEIDALSEVIQDYPEVVKRKITLTVGDLPDDDFALTRNRTITLNAKVLRDKKLTEENIKKSGIFASSKAENIIVHEFGHILSSAKGNKGIEITKKAYYNIYNKNVSDSEALVFLQKNVSSYAVSYDGDLVRDIASGRVKMTKYIEITSEVLAKHKEKPNRFTEEYLRLLKEE